MSGAAKFLAKAHGTWQNLCRDPGAGNMAGNIAADVVANVAVNLNAGGNAAHET